MTVGTYNADWMLRVWAAHRNATEQGERVYVSGKP